MVRGKRLIIPHKRRRERKTDYKKRLNLLLSRKPRFVVRKSLNNLLCQIIQYDKLGDKTLVFANSRELKEFGFPCSGNIPAAYLIGLLCGLKAKKKNIEEAILDIGLYESTKSSRIYAALKGALDAGLKIPYSQDILPAEERITGQHIASYAARLKKESQTKYKRTFSQYIKNKIQPENLPTYFEKTKLKILGSKQI